MTASTTTRLTLELDAATEPIQGRISEEGAASREFIGWLGLAAALGEVLKPAAEGKATV